MFRTATDRDLLGLAELEREANLAALGHVFPPETHPFPFDDVLARWGLVLDDPAVDVLVIDRETLLRTPADAPTRAPSGRRRRRLDPVTADRRADSRGFSQADAPTRAPSARQTRRLGALAAYAAYDGSDLRHLAVHPAHWGEGLATAAVDASVAAMRRRGSTSVSLWVLEENHRARRLYTRLGWTPTGERQEAAWPPHPAELRYARDLRVG